MYKLISKIVFLTIVTFSLTACSKDPEDSPGGLASSSGLLKYVPADTPYLIAMTTALPDDVLDKFEAQADATLRLYPALVKGVITSLIEKEEEGTDVEALQQALPFVDELDSLMSVDGLKSAGIDRDSMFVAYGAGLLPVIRVTLRDGGLMEDTLSRLEKSADKKMSVATVDQHEYRYADNDDARVIVAVIDDALVLGIVPISLSEQGLKTVLGLSLPDRNIAEAGTIQELARKYGFSDYIVGFMDFTGIASVFIDEQSGINAEILANASYSSEALSDACKADARAIAGAIPRLVFGYTDVNVREVSSRAILELRPDLAAGVAKLTSPVQGLGSDQGGIFSMGMSMNLLAAREFYAERLDALESDPYQCEDLADIQDGVAQGRQFLSQPVPPIVYGFKGFLAVVENIEGLDIQKQQPPTSIDMRLLLSMENAEGLLAMGAMFSPELASLDIEPDGKPVKLELGQLAAMGQTVHAAMTDAAIAVSVGNGPEQRLSGMLSAEVANPSPFVTFEMDAARYYQFVGEAMMANQDQAAMPEMMVAIQTMIANVQESVTRMSVKIEFSEHGIEMNSTVTLAE